MSISIPGVEKKEDPHEALKREWFEGLKKNGFQQGSVSCRDWLKARDQNETHELRDAVDEKSVSKNRTIHYAALNDDTDLIQTLFDSGADMTVTNKLGSTALHLACVAGSSKAVKLLVQYSRDLEAPNKIQNTALHCAVLSGKLDTVVSLVEAAKKKYPDAEDFDLRQALKTPNLASFTPGMYANYYDDIANYLKELLPSKSED